jgi:hypothetical protein
MTARKPTKAERAAKRRAKERAAARDTRQPLLPIDLWAASVVEAYAALVRAGWDKDHARWYLEETMKLPDWIIGNPDHSPYEEDEDEDE